MAKSTYSKKELLAQAIARAVGAGKAVALETVDFNDPNRPKTCLEVDFPLVPINEIAGLEASSGALKKPVYQMSKWWARRQSSVFRSMLIAAATKAPEDTAHAAKLVWDNYYANYQKKGVFNHLKVADIFMGGGTTLVEGIRLGMQLSGNDLNPVAWFVVKQETANVDLTEVKRLLADIEAEVKPQIIPYFYCDGPNGEKGTWTHIPTGRTEGADFDPLLLSPEQRHEYKYEGPEIIYTFWAKHGPCQVTGCGHRTPLMTKPVFAVKTLSVTSWEVICSKCAGSFNLEDKVARMAPDVPLYVTPDEHPYSVFDPKRGIVCPHCGHNTSAVIHSKDGLVIEGWKKLGKGTSKKISFTLLVHPQWLDGSPKVNAVDQPLGGSSQDDACSTTRWNEERASKIQLLEVRGNLPEEVTCPKTLVTFKTTVQGGTIPKQGYFICRSCGTMKDQLSSFKVTGKTGPMAGYAIQGFSRNAAKSGDAYNGRFFTTFNQDVARQFNAALSEWEVRKDTDLAPYWPKGSKIPPGHEAHQRRPLDQHGYIYWTDMFNPRQLLVNAHILKAITTVGSYTWEVREYVLGAFQQFIRCNTLLSIWHLKNGQISAALSNSNFHPRSTSLEPSPFSPVGDGSWLSAIGALEDALTWKERPWELVSKAFLERLAPALAREVSGKTEKSRLGDSVSSEAKLICSSSTDLSHLETSTFDLVITDPPFGDLVQYAELADFFYVWLRLVLKLRYPEVFIGEYSPKTLEAVANPFREPEDPNGFYQRLLTQCWQEAYRILKPGGILAFTFHHSEDDPWVSVLESLFDAGFYLEATYPIRSDETKGEGQFGSQKVEYDIIHVCRKRTEEPKPVSWSRMRREVLADVRQIQSLLENHAKEGLPTADLQVIRRGKALEYFSRHYGKVYVDEERAITVKHALVGINQLIDEDANRIQEPPPVNAEPISRQFLRIFDSKDEVARDQMQKFLRGSGIAPDEFEQRGWCVERNKTFYLVNPLDFARDWHGRHKRRLISDLDQSLVLVGACFDGSGINASDTLKNENFKPHPAMKALLDWLSHRGATSQTRNAAARALAIYNNWAATHQQQVQQMALFQDEV